ncbi:alpha beta hydrolase fold domain-containing protein [Cystoisospora suis]|uniref:Alpha beta hydrolase fold domain-containing protein n=1 Tax=Cystoisospora suis TaxID=483139 RepID=A0A2C6LFC9_9APIC|nr:alpha beta hydrolase fold domain-containing protein [Cystoisospora suis]
MSKPEEASQASQVLSKETVEKTDELENADNEREDAKREGVPLGAPPMEGPKPPAQDDEDSEASQQAMARFRLLTQLVPTRFVLRTVCPGIFTYAKATGWPSSRTQLIRDRQLADVSLRSFYASLRPSRLRHQIFTKIQTPRCPVFIYSQRPSRHKEFLGKGGAAGFWTSLGASTGGNAVLSTLSAMMGSPDMASSPDMIGVSSQAKGGAGEQVKQDDERGTGERVAPPVVLGEGSQTSAGPPLPMPENEGGATKEFASLDAIREGVERQERHAETVLKTEGPRAPSVNHLPSQQRGGWVEAAVKIAALLHSDWGGNTTANGADQGGEAAGGGKKETRESRPSVCGESHQASSSSLASSSSSSCCIGGNEESEKQQKWIFFLHGGAFIFNTPDSYKLFINDISVLTGAKVYCPDYKLAPEAVWPAQLEESLAAYEYLCNEMGAQGENIVLLGDSAGGNLAVTVMAKILEREAAATQGGAGDGKAILKPLPRPAGMVLLSPWLDLSMKGPSYLLNAANEPVLPLTSIRRAAHVYVHGTFDVAPVDAEDSDDIADETLTLESRLKSRGASEDMEASRAGSSISVTEQGLSGGGRPTMTNPWISPVYFDKALLCQMPPTLVHVGSLEVLLSDSLTFSRQVNEAVRNCSFPKQIWKAKDLGLYEQNPSLPVHQPKSLLASLPNAGPSAGVTAKKIYPLKRIDKKSSEPSPGGGAAAAPASKACSTPEPVKGEKDTSSEGRRDGWRAPEHFTKHGWLSEEDFNLLDKDGVVCPVGCNEDGVDRVRVKVWKDEFHVFPCCSFLEAPNGEKSLLEIAAWIDKLFGKSKPAS